LNVIQAALVDIHHHVLKSTTSIWSVWFLWSISPIWSVSCVWLNQTKTGQTR
jgi:hypothetical protein